MFRKGGETVSDLCLERLFRQEGGGGSKKKCKMPVTVHILALLPGPQGFREFVRAKKTRGRRKRSPGKLRGGGEPKRRGKGLGAIIEDIKKEKTCRFWGRGGRRTLGILSRREERTRGVVGRR